MSRHLLSLLTTVLSVCGTASGANFLASQTPGFATYPAVATITVEAPSGFNLGSLAFEFNGGTQYTFDITGDIEIWRSGPLDNYVDPLTGVPVGAAADALNTMRLEISKISNVMITSPTAGAGSLVIGDGNPDGTDNNGPLGSPVSLFSSGGAAEVGPDGSLADGYLDLVLEVNVTNPTIPTPLGSIPIGFLHNDPLTPLHFAASISEYPPAGIPFVMTNGPVSMYSRTDHPFVLALNSNFGRPLNPLEMARFVSGTLTIVPEPGTVFGAMVGAAAVAIARRRTKRSAARSIRIRCR